MIFTQQLGTLEGKNSQEAIKSVANHLRRMQEELEYRLSVLDSSNINEINALNTQILLPNGNLVHVIEDQEGNYSELTHTVHGLGVRVEDAEGKYTELSATVEGVSVTVGKNTTDITNLNVSLGEIKSTVEQHTSDIAGNASNITTLTQNATKIEARVSATETTLTTHTERLSELSVEDGKIRTEVSEAVSEVDGKYDKRCATLEQTAKEIVSTVSEYKKEQDSHSVRITAVEQTAESITSTVQSYEEDLEGFEDRVSVVEQTAESISASVAAISDDYGKVTAASIVMAINDAGSSVQISADHIDLTGITTFSSDNGEGFWGGTDYKQIKIEDGKISFMDRWGRSSNGDIWYSNSSDEFVFSSLSSLSFSTLNTITLQGVNFFFECQDGYYWVMNKEGLYLYSDAGALIKSL